MYEMLMTAEFIIGVLTGLLFDELARKFARQRLNVPAEAEETEAED